MNQDTFGGQGQNDLAFQCKRLGPFHRQLNPVTRCDRDGAGCIHRSGHNEEVVDDPALFGDGEDAVETAAQPRSQKSFQSAFAAPKIIPRLASAIEGLVRPTRVAFSEDV